ncbi:MAG: nucleotidyltransferase domain-containing protein [Cyanobacteria bacterium J06598_1]
MAAQTHVEQKYIDYWKARQVEYDAQCKVWEQEAWVDVKSVSALLRSQFGATKIVVFGSLVKDRFGEDSDIDLAVEGMNSRDLFKALVAVNKCSRREIDLKPMEDLDPYFKQRVLETGTMIELGSKDETV